MPQVEVTFFFEKDVTFQAEDMSEIRIDQSGWTYSE